ncbi:MAG: hypothetical protein R3253_10650 [Longimicrobiales bacterium]|nr:hypothetical protein [Longimicrobiales bacterium]
MTPRVAAFVSGHGFGHAARSSAVLAALHLRTGTEVELFTDAPRWFFDESIQGIFRYHREVVDVGFRQRSALRVDLKATVEALEDFFPLDAGKTDRLGGKLDRLAGAVRRAGCRAVLCDISPLGVAVAERAGLPSVVMENFTWGWLYEPLHSRAPRLAHFGAELDGWIERADVHLQARPVCDRRRGLEQVDPVSREPRSSRVEVRARLGIDDDQRLTVITMGGYGEDLPFLEQLKERTGERFLVTGAPATGVDGNLLLFDNATPLYMPDLLRAADAVVAKLGYGTVAEVWREDIPFAWVSRDDFREMEALEAFASEELRGFGMRAGEFGRGGWIRRLPELYGEKRTPRGPGGAQRVAEVLEEVTAG